MDTNQLPKIAILADDLTSAADGAAPFVARGLMALIGRGDIPHQTAAVISVNSGSRSASSKQASKVVAKLAAQLAKCPLLYKTVDSTLRGHIKKELEACFKASGRRSLVFAPAFPEAGRTTVNGIQLVHGIPVAQSVYGHDPVHPAKHSALVEFIPSCVKSVTLINAATQAELDSQIASIEDPDSVLWVGSPGMALALSRRFMPTAPPLLSLDGIRSDVLIVIGSANPRSHCQADLVPLMDGVKLLRGPIVRKSDSDKVLRCLADDAVRELKTSRVGALIATGGDTMEAILDRLHVREFEVLQELAPGFPLGYAHLEDGRPLMLAMKAGGFGDNDVLANAVMQIRRATHLIQKD
jgi:D-threonate/D-erythronate kinase